MITIEADVVAQAILQAADEAGESILDVWTRTAPATGRITVRPVTHLLAAVGRAHSIAWAPDGDAPAGFDLRIVEDTYAIIYLRITAPGQGAAGASATLDGGGSKATVGGGHIEVVVSGGDA